GECKGERPRGFGRSVRLFLADQQLQQVQQASLLGAGEPQGDLEARRGFVVEGDGDAVHRAIGTVPRGVAGRVARGGRGRGAGSRPEWGRRLGGRRGRGGGAGEVGRLLRGGGAGTAVGGGAGGGRDSLCRNDALRPAHARGTPAPPGDVLTQPRPFRQASKSGGPFATIALAAAIPAGGPERL